MNIFLLSDKLCAEESARMQCDKHIVKMCLETAQILCDAFHAQNLNAPYKKCNPNHPSTKWARASLANYMWTIRHGLYLCSEYTRRYGKTHKSLEIIKWCNNNVTDLMFPVIDKLLPPVSAISVDSICKSKVANFDSLPIYMQYRWYYVFDKPFAKWEKIGNTPLWYTDMRAKVVDII